MPISWDDLAPWNMTQSAEIEVDAPSGERVTLAVTYYRNRINFETFLEWGRSLRSMGDVNRLGEGQSLPVAHKLCELVASWDVMGPYPVGDGTMAGSADEPVPLEPRIVQYIDPLFRMNVINAIVALESPNRVAPQR